MKQIDWLAVTSYTAGGALLALYAWAMVALLFSFGPPERPSCASVPYELGARPECLSINVETLTR